MFTAAHCIVPVWVSQVRRMLKAVGYRTERLCRVSIGEVRLDGLASGEVAEVTRSQVLKLYADTCSRADASLRAMPTYDDHGREWVRAAEMPGRDGRHSSLSQVRLYVNN